jgi:two-component system phosphate regulon sensor histidine kinase PhoR
MEFELNLFWLRFFDRLLAHNALARKCSNLIACHISLIKGVYQVIERGDTMNLIDKNISSELAKDLINGFPMACVLLGRDEFVVMANSHAERIFGNGLIDRHYLTLVRDPAISDAIYAVKEHGGKRDIRWNTIIASIDRTFLASITSIGTSYLLMTLEDQTQLEQSKQLRRDFVSNVSHELKTPLTSILGFLESIQTVARNDEEAKSRFLQIMTDEAKRMSRLVNDLLSLNRVENEESITPTDEVDLISIINETIENTEPVYSKSNNFLTFSHPNQPIVVKGSRDQLQQVVTNLLENAVKYGGPNKEVKIELTGPAHFAVLGRVGVTLDVIDQGKGIAREHIPRLTERFYRVDSHRSREVGGTGLGLSIVKHIINRHDGRLRIKSVEGEGSTFSVFLPLD